MGGVGVGSLPVGTVTFLFTDVEGSTHLWEHRPDEMRAALARHDDLLRDAISSSDGRVFKTTGDGVLAAFADPASALEAAAAVQQVVEASLPFRVRVAVHSGAAELRDDDYFGSTLNRAARLLGIGHGGQVLVSHATEQLARDRLADGASLRDLGEHRLRDLTRPERVFQLVWPGLGDDFGALRSLDVSPTNLPVQLTSFVGRDEELAAVGELLGTHRMVTLTGTGGVGKTRLAMHLGAELLDRYPDGVWLAELASVEAPRVVEVIAAALGVDLQPGVPLERCLLEALTVRKLMLVLDNCEHIVREGRRIVEMILREAPEVSLLVTSREGLRVPGEQLYSVPSLDDDAAVALFVERATEVDSRFTVDHKDRSAVASLCARLDGVPLAIELAAARARMFNLDELARRVDQRFRLLTGGRGAVERHQTLRAAIDWSFDLLEAEERVAFARFSVFAGGATLEAAEAVIADTDGATDGVLEVLTSLVDKSLLIVDRSRSSTRYAMLETIRQYAQEHLVDRDDAETVRARHARWYADFARAAGRGLYTPDERAWVEHLQAEIDNLQVAATWSIAANETELAMRFGGSFPRQAMARPFLGTAYLAEQAMQVEGFDEHVLRARVMAEAAWARLLRGDGQGAEALLARAIDAQRHGARYAAAAYTYSLIGLAWEWTERSYEIAKEGLARAEAAGDVLGTIGSRVAFAAQAMLTERDAEAIEHAERALAEARALRQPTIETAAMYVCGLAYSKTDPVRAIGLLHESVDLASALDNESERVSALALLAALEARHGDPRQGLIALREQMMVRTVTTGYFGVDLYIAVDVFNRVGRPDLAARCDGLFQQLMSSSQLPLSPPAMYVKFHEQAMNDARQALGDEAFEQHVNKGASIPPDQVREAILQELDNLIATTSPG